RCPRAYGAGRGAGWPSSWSASRSMLRPRGKGAKKASWSGSTVVSPAGPAPPTSGDPAGENAFDGRHRFCGQVGIGLVQQKPLGGDADEGADQQVAVMYLALGHVRHHFRQGVLAEDFPVFVGQGESPAAGAADDVDQPYPRFLMVHEYL